MVQKVRWPVVPILAVALVAALGACGQKAVEVKVDHTHIGTVDHTNLGTRVLLHPGEIFGVTLKGTTWTFNQVSDPSVLAELPSQAGTSHPPVRCAPELGCDVTNAWYKALAPGFAVVSATRIGCAEEQRCVADEALSRVMIEVVA
jgi:hypothetical protein